MTDLDASRAELPVTVLLLPDRQGSSTAHWPTRWAHLYGYRVVEQHDWVRPRRGDWLARLDETVIDAPGPLVLVAQGLGCILLAAWATMSRHTERVQAAMLVSPVDMMRPEMKNTLPGWSPVLAKPMPFPSMLVGVHNDPDGGAQGAQSLAAKWGSRWVDLDDHAAALSGDWPQGHALLQTLLKE